MKNIPILAFATILTLTSCEKFLEEEYLSGGSSSTIVSTQENMDLLVNSIYASLRIWYGTENGWDLTESGTDIYTFGLDNRSAGFCTYSGLVGEEQDRMAAMWYELYKALNACNLAISSIDDIDYENETLRNTRKGELLFLRAHYLWQITETWGAVHFTTEPITTAVYTANRTPIPTFYDQIFSDLNEALDNDLLPAQTAEYGRITEPITKAFLSRMHLYWASYCRTGLSVNGQEFIPQDQSASQEHYQKAYDLAVDVIENYGFALLDDWQRIWSIDNIKNDEIVFAVNYSDNSQYTTANLMNPWDDDYWDESNNNPDDMRYNTSRIIQRDGGNMGHLMWEIRYENLGWGMTRDIQNGRGFQRWMPTKYLIDLFDEKTDQRFYKSFKNVWYCNSESATPRWRPFMYIDGVRINIPDSLWAKPMFQLGDTAIYFSKTPVPSSMKAKYSQNDVFSFHPSKGYIIIDINDMYKPDGSPNTDVINRQYYFPITKKYQDTTRLELAQQYSQRDAYVIRISELYLIAAEAALERDNPGEAYDLLTTIADARSVDGNGAAMLVSYGIAGPQDITIDFILDERARELATENQRFFDLKRTGNLVTRLQDFNSDAAPNIANYHVFRFIPQEQLDAVQNKDEFTNNPGYN